MYVGVEVEAVETGGARDARYVPDVDEYEGRYAEGVIELYFDVEVDESDEAASFPY